MKNWKAIIVDDEPPAIRELSYMLEPFPQINILGEAESFDQAKELIKKINPDLIFLDIDLGNNSGFDLMPHIPLSTQVVFVTAYDSFAIRAFEVNALDYLLKPVHPERLKNCIQRLGNPFTEDLSDKLKPFDQILIGVRNGSRFVAIKSVSCIEACGDYTKLYAADGHTGVVHHTMKRWTERLPANLFLQIHRSYIINTEHVVKINKVAPESYQTYLTNPKEPIPVSRRYSRLLLQKTDPQKSA